MLELSDDSNQSDNEGQPEGNPGQPENDSNLPSWDDLPDNQITEITPDPGKPALPPEMEQKIIRNILNGTFEVFKLPAVKKSDHNQSVN